MENCNAGEGCSATLVILTGLAEGISKYPYVVVPVLLVVGFFILKGAVKK